MKIILNLLPLKTGGGVQVALDFIKQAELYGKEHQWFVVARESGAFSAYSGCKYIKVVHLVKDDLFHRLIFEYIGCKEIIKQYQPDLIYTQFGPHWPGSSCINVAGCAYSNLFYPELNFWSALSPLKKFIKKFIDKQRLNRILEVDHRIFETEDLRNRAIKQYGLSIETTHFVRAAASSLVNVDASHVATKKLCEDIPTGYRVGLLSGYHPNKNIELLVKTVAYLKKLNVNDVLIVLTLPKEHQGTQTVLSMAKDLGVSDSIYNLGPIPQEGCVEFYNAIDVAVLPSKLESFSNMIAESWATKTPLLISDLTWAKSLCQDGAIYFDYCSEASLSNKILELKNVQEIRDLVVENGSKILKTYPTSKERFEQYLMIIEGAVNA